MKLHCHRLLMVILILGFANSGYAATRYVRPSGSAPSAPYTSWATAAADIQTAVSACSSGDVVIVTNGTYTVASGSEVVLVSSGIHLQSVNGPSVTIIDAGNVAGIRRGLHITSTALGAVVEGLSITRGRADNNWGGGAKVEAGTLQNCVISNNWCSNNGDAGGVLVAGGIVSNCIITKNGAWVYAGGAQIDSGAIRDCEIYNNTCGSNASYGGGGVFVNGAAALLENCIIRDNRSGTSADGGGIRFANGTIQNCLIWRNTSAHSGGIYMLNGTIQNCTIVGNRNIATPTGSGFKQTGGTARNLIIWGNSPFSYFTYDKNQCPDVTKTGGTLTFSCTRPVQSGTGNIALEPAFIDPDNGDFHLAPGSAGIDAGTNLPAITRDVEGTSRPVDGDDSAGAFHDLGCYESAAIDSGTFRCSFSFSTNEGISSVPVVLRPQPAGTVSNITWYGWDIDNNGSFDYSGAGSGIVTQTFGIGFHTVTLRLTNSSSASATCTRSNIVRVATPTAYVRPSGGTPTPPYSSWDTAAIRMDDAMQYVTGGCTIWVTNGTYAVTSQVEVVKGITLKSMNGSDNTLITRASGDTRIMLVAAPDAVVEGFRMENGYITSAILGGIGAGLYLAEGTVRACTIATNYAASNGNGGGICMIGGRLDQCTVTRNRGWIYAGGIYLTGGIVENCLISTNTCGFNPTYHGGGIYMTGGTVRNSIVQDNRTGSAGAGAGIYLNGGIVDHCTVAYNTCGTGTGGGIYRNSGTVTNSIIYYNLRDLSVDNYSGNLTYIRYSCATELTNGTGNIVDTPSFTDTASRDFHLLASSPCIDTGANATWVTNDFEGSTRPQDGDAAGGAQHDMGAYERQDASVGALDVDFSVSPDQGLQSVDAVFQVTATGSETNLIWYGWDFDNNGTWELEGGGLGRVTNTFTAGIHPVTLLITNVNLDSASQTKLSAVQVSPMTLYVSNNGSHTQPYTNWVMASTNIGDAYSLAVNGATILLSNGTYRLTQTLTISKHITILGGYGPSNTVITRKNTGADLRLAYLDATGAVLQAVTLTNGYGTFLGPGLMMTDGTVRDCIIRNCTIPGNSHGAIYISGGTLENCLVMTNKVNLYGGGIYLAGGLVQNCRILWNRAGSANAGFGGGGVYLNGGIVQNCLIAGNLGGSSAAGGGAHVNAGILESCTVVGNTGGTTGGGGIYRSGGAITNCIAYSNQVGTSANDAGGAVASYWYSCAPELNNPVNNNIMANPGFKTPGSGFGLTHTPGDYRLEPGSLCFNAGIAKPWMLPAQDLAGLTRISGGVPDIGAYEIAVSGGAIFLFR